MPREPRANGGLLKVALLSGPAAMKAEVHSTPARTRVSYVIVLAVTGKYKITRRCEHSAYNSISSVPSAIRINAFVIFCCFKVDVGYARICRDLRGVGASIVARLILCSMI
jgi:hypothetical protein